MMRAIRPPESKQATTLLVAVRCRPLTPKEQTRSRDILRVVDDKVVVVLDPDVHKDYLDRVQNRSKEKKYVFDIAFGPDSTNQDVYKHTVGNMVEGVVRGLNATIFAYGATGSGKTHTMAGTAEDPGLMVQSLQAIFALISKKDNEHEFEVTCSYLEVYNEVIYDLLEKSSGHLELREDPDQGITVAGLKRIQVSSAEKILELLNQGNSRRKTESTDANATSSRSHAVLEIIVKRKQKNQYRSQVLKGKLALVDLAGSERASETNNAGQKLRDGANINRSLLALATCINALGKQQKKGLAYVPYRNSKLTRLLKDGLSGNSRTVMVANVSSGDDQYHHTTNTLKYADRAKEIKTHIQTNIGTVDAHVADYQRMIDNLQVEVSQLRRELADKDTQLSARTPDKTADDELSWLDVLSNDINENVEERINLQKAVFELEDMNARNKAELQLLDEQIVGTENVDKEEIESLVERRQVILDNIRDNDEAGAHYRQDIEANEAQRKQLQKKIDEAIASDRNKTFLRILSQYRLLGMTNMELQFQMAIRDQIIHDQREALNNLWLVLESSGLDHHQILEIAAQEGIVIEDGLMASSLSSSMAPSIATSIAPSISRCHVPATPVPILHNQSLAAAGSRYTNLMQLQLSSDSVVTSDYKCKSDSYAVDEKDTASSVKSLAEDWKNSSMQEDKIVSQVVDPKLQATCYSNQDHPTQGTCYSNQDHPTPEDVAKYDGYESNGIQQADKCKGANVTRLTGFFESKLSPTATEQPNSVPLSRGRSPPESAEIKVSPATKQRRRPRSGEGHQQHRWSLEIGDGSTTGVDAGSEGSETDDSDTGWNDPSKRQTDPMNESFQGGADNELLRRELARLESELQELKKGLDRTSGAQSYPGSANKHGPAASESELQDLRRTISRNCSELQDLKRAINRNTNSASYGGSKMCIVPNGSPASTNSSNNGSTANGLSNGHGYPAYPAYSTPGVDTRAWGRVGTPDTPCVVEVPANRGSSLVPTEVLEHQGYSASAVHRLGKGPILRSSDFSHPRKGLAEVGASNQSIGPRLSPDQRQLYERAALRDRQRTSVSRKILCS